MIQTRYGKNNGAPERFSFLAFPFSFTFTHRVRDDIVGKPGKASQMSPVCLAFLKKRLSGGSNVVEPSSTMEIHVVTKG